MGCLSAAGAATALAFFWAWSAAGMVSMVSISTTSPLEPVRPEGAQPMMATESATTDVASASATVPVRPVRNAVRNVARNSERWRVTAQLLWL